jgi:hypothetical protein
VVTMLPLKGGFHLAPKGSCASRAPEPTQTPFGSRMPAEGAPGLRFRCDPVLGAFVAQIQHDWLTMFAATTAVRSPSTM